MEGLHYNLFRQTVTADLVNTFLPVLSRAGPTALPACNASCGFLVLLACRRQMCGAAACLALLCALCRSRAGHQTADAWGRGQTAVLRCRWYWFAASAGLLLNLVGAAKRDVSGAATFLLLPS